MNDLIETRNTLLTLDVYDSAMKKLNLKQKTGKVLNKKNYLPEIILPQKKLDMFIDWWNEDIRYEAIIPHTFNEGYLVFTDMQNMVTKDRDLIKSVITFYKKIDKEITYRRAENFVDEFLKKDITLTVYFKFFTETQLKLEVYYNGRQLSNIEFEYGNSDVEDIINLYKLAKPTEEIQDNLNFVIIYLLSTVFWYISTTTKNTKYISEKPRQHKHYSERNIIDVKDNKIISTPIYDFNKIRYVQTSSLINRKKGWTYSHAFRVCGHYRHYRDGKVIFIESYIKGKEKEFKKQTITLNPAYSTNDKEV